MEDYYQHKKQYCREGESEATIALGYAIAAMCVAFVLFWIGVFVFL